MTEKLLFAHRLCGFDRALALTQRFELPAIKIKKKTNNMQGRARMSVTFSQNHRRRTWKDVAGLTNLPQDFVARSLAYDFYSCCCFQLIDEGCLLRARFQGQNQIAFRMHRKQRKQRLGDTHPCVKARNAAVVNHLLIIWC